MYDYFFGDYTMAQVIVLAVSAVLIGINKTGLPGLGMIPVILLAEAFDARLSTGLQLLMLATADIMAVAYYRRQADWKIVLRLLPWALLGIALGTVAIEFIDDRAMRPVLGWILLFIVGVSHLGRRLKKVETLPDHWGFSAGFGAAAGFTTQVANAAGPIMNIYLLSMRLPKEKYIGCAAWYFLILNWIKVPIFAVQGRITPEAVRADLPMVPFLVLGAALGIYFLKKVPQKAFEIVVEILVVAGAVKLLF